MLEEDTPLFTLNGEYLTLWNILCSGLLIIAFNLACAISEGSLVILHITLAKLIVPPVGVPVPVDFSTKFA